jgi:hypothetical protein
MIWSLLRRVALAAGMLGAILIICFEAGDLSLDARDYVQVHLTELENLIQMR